ncbi:glycosyltransferase [Bacillus sp. USDA818B3_A]|uniref:glycosyltransferase n=1 Tax=Bacillus sp. USDA818B3_A TaxID=2698834 RepID=UPI00136F8A41|nr:glycosyltransferase [Bacillus sp. USDA818B3_A]
MKKLVIVTHRFGMGGIGKALISMLKSIPKEEYQVTVLVMEKGLLEDEVPNHVKVENLYGSEKSALEKIWKLAKKGRLIQAFKIGWYMLLAKGTKDRYKYESYYSKMIPVLNSEYDLAISYHIPTSFPVVFVVNNIKAKKKFAWIHSDVSAMIEKMELYKNYFEKYDKIFCVSEFAKNKFIDLLPQLKAKTSVFYNILDGKNMEEMAVNGEGFSDHFKGIRILTVGRLSSEKGQDIIPRILFKLKAAGHNVRWYCIGDGTSRSELEKLIRQYGLEENLIILGTKSNPYNYIKQCDIYVQPSRHEAYCLSLAEARLFSKPIVTTDFVGAREQIINGKNGLIVNFDEIEIFNAVNSLIIKPELCEKFRNNLKNIKLDTTNEINKLFEGVS